MVTPGLVDAHTHLVFAGRREQRVRVRLQGAGYLEILAAGGGIMATVRATRDAGGAGAGRGHAWAAATMLAHGTTSVEVKSGYGLSTEAELRSLRAIRLLAEDPTPGAAAPRPTFLGAHAVPPEYADRADAYVAC